MKIYIAEIEARDAGDSFQTVWLERALFDNSRAAEAWCARMQKSIEPDANKWESQPNGDSELTRTNGFCKEWIIATIRCERVFESDKEASDHETKMQEKTKQALLGEILKAKIEG